MRTTLDLDEDLLLVTKQISQQKQLSMGRVVSQLLRKALEPAVPCRMRNGIPVFSARPGAVKPDLELINRLRDDL